MHGARVPNNIQTHTYIQCEAPKIAKLVYNFNNYGLWYTNNYSYRGSCLPNYNWGASHCTYMRTAHPADAKISSGDSQLIISRRTHRQFSEKNKYWLIVVNTG